VLPMSPPEEQCSSFQQTIWLEKIVSKEDSKILLFWQFVLSLRVLNPQVNGENCFTK
jgi:hypothetical protein